MPAHAVYDEGVVEALPVAIRTEPEYRRLLRIAASLMEKPDESVSESEILSGKRAISKAQARQLAGFFRVTVDLFL